MCNKIINEKNIKYISIDVLDIRYYYKNYNKYELCIDCYKEVFKFINNKKKVNK